MMDRIKLKKNGKSLDFLTSELSTDRISAIQVSLSIVIDSF